MIYKKMLTPNHGCVGATRHCSLFASLEIFEKINVDIRTTTCISFINSLMT